MIQKIHDLIIDSEPFFEDNDHTQRVRIWLYVEGKMALYLENNCDAIDEIIKGFKKANDDAKKRNYIH